MRKYFTPKVGERKLTRPYIICKSQLRQWLLRSLWRTAIHCRSVVHSSRIDLSSIALKQEQLTAIHYLYQRKDVFLWLPTGFGKLVCNEVLPFQFDFAGSKSGSIVLRWTEQLLGLHTYCGKPSPFSIGNNSSRLKRPGRSSISPFQPNNEDDRFGDTSD